MLVMLLVGFGKVSLWTIDCWQDLLLVNFSYPLISCIYVSGLVNGGQGYFF